MWEILQRLYGGELIALAGVLAAVIVLVVLIVMGFWSSMSAAKAQAALKRDMLARGLTAEDIERLTQTEGERQARLESDRKVREAQVAADLKRDLLARGLSVEQVLRLIPGEGAGGAASEASVLADTIKHMIHDGDIDRDALVRLIEAFMKRAPARPADLALESYLEAVKKEAPAGDAGAVAR